MTPRQSLFVREYLVDLNATQAAIRAGYSQRTADVQGPRLLGNVRVSEAIAKGMQVRANETELSATYVVTRLKLIAERCMQAEQLLDKAGKPTGVYRFNSSGANRALELLGKHIGMFTDRLEINDLRNLSDEELKAELDALERSLGRDPLFTH